jgi:hypothetical protein
LPCASPPEAFAGTTRVIIGTGDQVGRETPEENLYAMIDEARKEGIDFVTISRMIAKHNLAMAEGERF